MRTLAIVLVLLLAGCETFQTNKGGTTTAGETVTVTETALDGTTVETVTSRSATAVQPENPTEGAGATAGMASASNAGGAHKPANPGMLLQARTMTWMGAGCVLLGVIVFAARFTSFPFARVIPWTGSVALVVVGVGFLTWPSLDPVTKVVAFLVGAGILVYLVMHNGSFANLFKSKLTKEPTT